MSNKQYKKILSRFASASRRMLGMQEPHRSYRILGNEMWLREASIRLQPDYDDAWVMACSMRAQTIYDIGANVGYDSLLCLVKNPTCKVVLVEANPQALMVAADNLIRNHLSTQCVFIAAFAGSEEKSKVEFWTTGTGAAGSIHKGHAQTAATKGCSISVPMTTLDAIWSKTNNLPDFVKIDVEGAEQVVLQGAKRVAGERKTRFLVEMHSPSILPMQENANKVLDWARQAAYRCWYLKDHVQLTSPNQIGHRGRCHLLIQPEEWEFPPWLANIEQSAPLEKAWQGS